MLNEFTKKEAPIQGLAGLGGGVPSRLLTLAAGTTTYVDDVFSTFLYDGTGSAQTITNGIDLDGEGGLVWVKSRSTRNHILSDTERGTGKVIFSNSSSGEDADATTITSYNSNGFTMGSSTLKMNTSGEEFVSWTFRKCRGFFDVVTYTGNGVAGRTVSHNLGSVPGCIMVKNLDASEFWEVYHRGIDSTAPEDYRINLDRNVGRSDSSTQWNDTAPTSTEFTLGTNDAVNKNGDSYVAYIFAHNDGSFGEDSDEAVIKCGTYAGSGNEQTISLGFEPQWLLVKNRAASYNWIMLDMMRMWTDDECIALVANNTDADAGIESLIDSSPVSNGFTMNSNYDFINKSGNDYIYIAIRRPHKPPEAATEVFDSELLTSASQTSTPGFAPDMVWQIFNRSYPSFYIGNRLTGNKIYLQTYSGNGEGSFTSWEFDAPTGEFTQSLSSGSTTGGIQYFFKRAPGFFDIVTYDGTGSTKTESHNLGVAPELMLVKRRSGAVNWAVYYGDNTDYIVLNGNGASVDNDELWNDTSPTASVFTVGPDNDVNASNNTYIALLFASLDEISKVGSYTGTGSAINVDCGFTAGARLVIIKRTDAASSDWFAYDSARGIVSGNDPYVLLNSTSAEVTNTDYIDPLNAGFTVTSSAPASLNASGGNYIFLAIA
jgi:hypothetical protein|tara:strand:- start:48 stop:2021 length:1974 start_codon:yes stop_codon:yes gene_type:complete